MTGLAARFFGSAIGYAVLGMTLGLIMGMSHDHGQMPTHAHLLVVGWVSFAVFGIFYHLLPAAAASRLAVAHFWLAQVSLVVLIMGLFLLFGGQPSAEPVVALASLGLLASMILFAVVAFPFIKVAR